MGNAVFQYQSNLHRSSIHLSVFCFVIDSTKFAKFPPSFLPFHPAIEHGSRVLRGKFPRREAGARQREGKERPAAERK